MNRPLFEQAIGESDKAFHAFKTYRDMGPERSIRAVGRKLNKAPQQLAKWSNRFNWAERLAAWAKHIEELERQAIEVKAREKAHEWAAREEAHRERGWKVGEALIKRAEAMLEFPLATTRSRDGKTIVNPTAWTMGHAARLAEIGYKLAALALGLPTNRAEVTGKDGTAIAPQAQAQVVFYIPEEKPMPADDYET